MIRVSSTMSPTPAGTRYREPSPGQLCLGVSRAAGFAAAAPRLVFPSCLRRDLRPIQGSVFYTSATRSPDRKSVQRVSLHGLVAASDKHNSGALATGFLASLPVWSLVVGYGFLFDTFLAR